MKTKYFTIAAAALLLCGTSALAQETVFFHDFEFQGDTAFSVFEVAELNGSEGQVGELSGDDFPAGDPSSFWADDENSAGITEFSFGGNALYIDRPIAPATLFADLDKEILTAGAVVSVDLGTRRTGGGTTKNYDLFGLDADGNESFRIQIHAGATRLGYVTGGSAIFDFDTVEGEDAGGDLPNVGGPAFAEGDVSSITLNLGNGGYTVGLANQATSFATTFVPYNGDATKLAQVGLFYQGVEGATGAQSGFFIDKLQVTGFEELLFGDFNGDATIDMADFLVLATNFGTGTTLAQGDFDFNGIVNVHDFVGLKQAFLATQGQAQTVPEPTGLTLLSLALMGSVAARRRRK